MYCRICGKDGAHIKLGELCRKCSKEYKLCVVCGGLYRNKELTKDTCFLCRNDKERIYGKE